MGIADSEEERATQADGRNYERIVRANELTDERATQADERTNKQIARANELADE